MPPVILGVRPSRIETLSSIITIVVVQVIGMHVNKLMQGVPGGIFGAARRAATGGTGQEMRESSNSEHFYSANGEQVEVEMEGGDMATVMLPKE